ncbi:transcriptional regulator protein, partial [Arthrobacter sp. Hiyo6]
RERGAQEETTSWSRRPSCCTRWTTPDWSARPSTSWTPGSTLPELARREHGGGHDHGILEWSIVGYVSEAVEAMTSWPEVVSVLRTQHHGIFEAFQAHDGELAANRLREHIEWFYRHASEVHAARDGLPGISPAGSSR